MFGRYRFASTRIAGAPTAAGATHSLTVTSGAYALTGTALTIKRGLKLTMAGGSYALTGRSVALARGTTISLGSGVYTLTGKTVALSTGGPRITMDGSSYTLTGSPMGLTFSSSLFVKLPPPPKGVFARI